MKEELFQEFLAMRIEAKLVKVNTPTSVKRLRNKLAEWELTGYNCDAILDHAIEKQWRGLYLPPRMTPKQNHKSAPLFAKDLAKKMRIPFDPTPQEINKSRAVIHELNKMLNP